MIKIGILTFHCAYNFGAILQCYALFSTIKSLGYDVEVIDYCPNYLATREPTFHRHTFINKSPWHFFKRVKDVINAKGHYNKFRKFTNSHLQLSPSCKSEAELKEVCNRYDCVIVGSDQVWCEKFNGKDSSWFGIETPNHLKWIGYAVSAGATAYDPRTLNQLISRFYAIGARELNLYKTLVTCSKSNIAHVLDPTLLASSSLWKKWCSPILKEPYVLTYQARESNDVFRIAKDIANQLGIKKIVPIDFYRNVKENGFDTYVCSPEEFIALVKNARCVVTTSFHGTAFSVILGTPFYTLRLNDGADARTQDFLDSINLSDRMVNVHSTINFSKYDTNKVSNELAKLKEQSLDFLKLALQ